MYGLFPVWAGLIFLLGQTSPTFAKENGQSDFTPPESADISTSHTATFQQSLTFSIAFVNEPRFEKVSLYLNAPNFRNTYRADFDIDAEAGSRIEFEHAVDLTAVQIEPFVTLTYWWAFESEDGMFFETRSFEVEYVDDRFDWEFKTSNEVTVYWTTGQSEIGQVAFDVTAEMLPKLSRFYQTELETPVTIFLYPTENALQTVFNSEWIGGVATPHNGRIMLPASNARTAVVNFRRQIPHELSHLFFDQLTANHREGAPKWLDEGLAVTFEDPPNSNYAPLLEKAFEEGNVIPFELLCSQFPTQSTDMVLLAYAQSGSLVNYIETEYGRGGLQALIATVNDGRSCENVTDVALGISLQELNTDWEAANQPPPAPTPFTFSNPNIFWIILLVGGFGLMGLLARSAFQPR
ncbi:MAG: peptidase MA family metallohydrolase [Ardenticatenaceae bacterium]|nr:peptidase MA family metallohydrolase [Ardenticatenaceae bacterium]